MLTVVLGQEEVLLALLGWVSLLHLYLGIYFLKALELGELILLVVVASPLEEVVDFLASIMIISLLNKKYFYKEINVLIFKK